MNKHIIAGGIALAAIAGTVMVAAPANATYGGGGHADRCYVAGEPRTDLTWVKEVYKQTAPAQPAVPESYEPRFDYSETRDTGHFEATADGLHIWTEGATSTDKVALYRSVDIPLLSVTSASVDYTATDGITPGSQLVVDIDGDGTGDGILVNEPVYGDVAWLSNSATAAFKALAPHTGGGYGSEWYGTLEEWGIKAPGATIVAVGFSLGSGVLGDGVVHTVNVGSKSYSFVTVIPGKDAVPAQYGWVSTGKTGQGSALPPSNNKVRYVQTGTVEVPTWDEVECDLAPVVTYGEWQVDEGTCETKATTSTRTVSTTPWVKEKVGYNKYVLTPGETSEEVERTAIAWTEERIAEECAVTPTPTPSNPTPPASSGDVPPQGLAETGGGGVNTLVPLAALFASALGVVLVAMRTIRRRLGA